MPFSFGHPWFLTALASVGIPLYLHLYYRKTPVKRDFPSLRLIRLSNQTLLNRSRLKNLILLMMRIFMILLLTFALARPFLSFGGNLSVGNGAPSAFVIVLDNSMSMGATHHGISLFNAAKARAIEILERMGPNDKASIILLNDPGTVLFPQLTWDKVDLKESIRNAGLTAAGTNLYGAMLPAIKMLMPIRSYKRSVYVISDVTKNSWKPFLDAYDLKRVDSGLDLVLVPVGGETAPPNLAITELSLRTPVVLKGRSVPVQATVVNFGSHLQKTVLSIFIDGDKKLEIPVELQPGEHRRVIASCTFAAEGVSHVRANLPADALVFDDSRHLAVKVLAPQKILILRPPPDEQGRDTPDDLYLRFALNPLNRREQTSFIIERRSPEEAVNVPLTPFTAVLLVNGRRLPPELVKSLGSYVMGGGNLLIIAGSRTDPNWYNTNLIDNMGSGYLLPARIVKRLGNAVSKMTAYQLTDFDVGHPSFRLFTNEENGDPGRAHIFEFFQVEPNPRALVLAKLSHGLPAIVEEPRGQGRVVLITFPLDVSWSDWPLKPTFLPFLHQTLFGLISRGGLPADSYLPGSPISMMLREEGLKKVTLTLPDGHLRDMPIRHEGPGLITVSTTDTDQAGFYQLVCEWSDHIWKQGFAVNPPAEESDMERMPTSEIPRFITLKQRPGIGEKLGEKVTLVREGREVGVPLLWALFILAFSEFLFANRPSSRAVKP
ncbi:MAG: BatA domain-containing protein [Candidatus Riflebacteria bacterium]|nr:BatA domain-containing protein [Candidatus Riflebacteria bacterium]